LPSSTPLKRLGAILARAKSFITGREGTAAPIRTGEALSAPESEADAGGVWEPAKQDKGFWVTMAGADRRLAELRRAIDQAAAEADTRELGVEAPWSNVGDPSLGERRCEKANRMIADALGRGEILIPPSTG
jgi:hypothetical protein